MRAFGGGIFCACFHQNFLLHILHFLDDLRAQITQEFQREKIFVHLSAGMEVEIKITGDWRRRRGRLLIILIMTRGETSNKFTLALSLAIQDGEIKESFFLIFQTGNKHNRRNPKGEEKVVEKFMDFV